MILHCRCAFSPMRGHRRSGSFKQERNEMVRDHAVFLISSRVTLQRSSFCALTRWEISLSPAPLTTQWLYGMLRLEGQTLVIVSASTVARVSRIILYSTCITAIDSALECARVTYCCIFLFFSDVSIL